MVDSGSPFWFHSTERLASDSQDPPAISILTEDLIASFLSGLGWRGSNAEVETAVTADRLAELTDTADPGDQAAQSTAAAGRESGKRTRGWPGYFRSDDEAVCWKCPISLPML
jgi:hypothetical protein